MHRLFYKSLFVLLFTAISCTALCQTGADSTITTADTTKVSGTTKKPVFRIGADYISNNVFMGRTGLTTVPIISPEIKYTFKSGLYFSGNADILPDNKANKIDGGNLTAGYDFDITDDFDAGIAYSKMFYNTNSTLVGSSITDIFNVNFDYSIGDILTPSISADYSLNSGGVPNDVFLNAGLAHDFIASKIFGDKDVIIVSPTVTANLGTQNFFDSYIKRKVFKNKKVTALVAAFETRLNQFKLLDYELSAPFEYKTGNFVFQFTPTYSIVENGFKSAALAKAVGLSNNASVFYIETGLALKF